MATGKFNLPITTTSVTTQAITGYTVRFYDYNGRLLKSQIVEENGSAIAPQLPNDDYLNFEYWNYDITGITKNIETGAIYTTISGASYIFLEVITGSTTGLTSLNITKNTTDLATIDWGDGSSNSTSTATGLTTFTHSYLTNGNFVIKIYSSSSTLNNIELGYDTSNRILDSNTRQYIKKIYVGEKHGLKPYSLGCEFLAYLMLSNGVSLLPSYCLRDSIINHLNLPRTLTQINSYNYNNRTIKTSLYRIVTAKDINLIIKSNSFYASSGDYGILKYIDLQYCNVESSALNYNNLVKLDLGYTTFAPTGCYWIEKVNIYPPLNTLISSSFNGLKNVKSFVMYSGITTISSNAFINCNPIEYVFYSTTPPTLASTTVFSFNTYTKIYVPDNSVSSYKSATNWNTFEKYITPISLRPEENKYL